MWHLLTAQQQESFLPFSSRQSLSCCLSRVAKRSTPEPQGPSSSFLQTRGALLLYGCCPRFKSQCPSSFAAPFPTPLTISYTSQHPCILLALLGCHSKPGQVWPHGMEPIISKLSRRPCNQGELLPSPIPLAQSMATAI